MPFIDKRSEGRNRAAGSGCVLNAVLSAFLGAREIGWEQKKAVKMILRL